MKQLLTAIGLGLLFGGGLVYAGDADGVCLLTLTTPPKTQKNWYGLIAAATVVELGETREITEEQRAAFQKANGLSVSRFVTHIRPARLKVSRVWSGPVVDTLSVLVDASARSMPPTIRAGDSEWLIFATAVADGWWIGECNPSQPIANAERWLKELGKPLRRK